MLLKRKISVEVWCESGECRQHMGRERDFEELRIKASSVLHTLPSAFCFRASRFLTFIAPLSIELQIPRKLVQTARMLHDHNWIASIYFIKFR